MDEEVEVIRGALYLHYGGGRLRRGNSWRPMSFLGMKNFATTAYLILKLNLKLQQTKSKYGDVTRVLDCYARDMPVDVE